MRFSNVCKSLISANRWENIHNDVHVTGYILNKQYLPSCSFNFITLSVPNLDVCID